MDHSKSQSFSRTLRREAGQSCRGEAHSKLLFLLSCCHHWKKRVILQMTYIPTVTVMGKRNDTLFLF